MLSVPCSYHSWCLQFIGPFIFLTLNSVGVCRTAAAGH